MDSGMATMTRPMIEIGMAAANTRNGDGPRYGRSARARRSMPCEPAPRISPIDRKHQADDDQHAGADPATAEERDGDQPETEHGSKPAEDEQRRHRPTLDRERRGAGLARAATRGSPSGTGGASGGVRGSAEGPLWPTCGSVLGPVHRIGRRSDELNARAADPARTPGSCRSPVAAGSRDGWTTGDC